MSEARASRGLSSVVVGFTGASGIIYGLRLVEEFVKRGMLVEAIVSEAAKTVARYELEEDLVLRLKRLNVKVYTEHQLTAPYASSSRVPDAMVVAPCSMRTLAAIAHGLADNLITRCALSVLRMKRTLILVVRETPLGVAEIRNMLLAAMNGAIILPASPAFYHKPRSLEDVVNFVVGKVLDVLGLPHNLYAKWSGESS